MRGKTIPAAIMLALCASVVFACAQPTGALPAGSAKPAAGSTAASPKPAAAPAGGPPGSQELALKPPSRPVEVFIPTGPGAGSDVISREVIRIIDKYGFSPQPFMAVNLNSGNMAEAYAYMDSKAGDGHVIMPVFNAYITTPIVEKFPNQGGTYPGLGLLATDPFVLWVHASSPIGSLMEFVGEARQRELVVGGSRTKEEDEILFKLVELRAGTQPFRYRPFSGGGAVCQALADGEIMATANQPSECTRHYPERVRPLAIFQERRAASLPDVPTVAEQGLDIQYANIRGMVSAPGITLSEQRWYIDLLRQVVETPDWHEFVQRNGLEARFLPGAEFSRFMTEQYSFHRQFMTSVGWLN